MKAWHFMAPETPLKLVEIPEPTPTDDEIVVDVKAAGICHTDAGFMDGTMMPALGHTPIVLGHEIAGVVSAVGANVTNVAPGDKVVVYPANDREGAPNMGLERDGGFAEKVAARAVDAIKVPEGVEWVQAAASTDAGMTSYHAVQAMGQVREGSRVGIIGLGGLGMTGARIAVLLGAEVYAAEINEEVHAAGLERGVKQVVTDASELAQFDLDVIIDFAGFGTTTAAAISAVKRFGRVVLVGLGAAEMQLNTLELVVKEVDLQASNGGLRSDIEGVLELIADGGLRINTKEIAFDEIPEGIDTLVGGGGGGQRFVAVM